MKKIVLFLILALSIACFTACDAIFENLGIGGSDNGNDGTGENKSGSVHVTITEYDGNGKSLTREQTIEFSTFAEFGGYEKWLEYSVTLWDIYRFETCFDITVNGKPIPDGYAISDGDAIVLKEKEPAYTVTLRQTTYDGGNTTYSYRLCEPITLEHLLELLIDDSAVYGHHIDYFKQAYSITAGGVAFSINSELSQDMQIDIYKNAPKFTLHVLSAESGYTELGLYENTDLYSALIDYSRFDVVAQMDAGYQVFFGEYTISNKETLRDYTATAENNTVIIRGAEGGRLKVSVDGEETFDVKNILPCSLDDLFLELFGITYSEAQNIFIIDTDGSIYGEFICYATYLNLKYKDELPVCKVTLNVYAHTGALISSQTQTVNFGTRLSDVIFSEFSPENIENNTDVYLGGKLVTKEDLNLLISEDITLEKRVVLSEDDIPLTSVYMELGDIDIHNPKYEFIVKLFQEDSDEYGDSNKTHRFDTPVNIDDLIESITGYTVYELIELDIYPEIRSQTENRSVVPNEPITGEYEVRFHSGKAIQLTVYREVGGVRVASSHALAHTRMYTKDFITWSSYLSGGSLSPASFTNKRVGADAHFFDPASYLHYGVTLDSYVIDWNGDIFTAENLKGIMVIGDYEPFNVKLYYNGNYVKTVTYTHAMKVEDVYLEVPEYTENSWCHYNGISNVGDYKISYLYFDCEIGIFDTYTPGVEVDIEKYK